MSRTTRKIPLKYDVDYTINVIESTLLRHGFENELVNGENAWALDGGGIISCFTYWFADNEIVFQAWVRDMIFGEMDLKGFVGSLPKKNLSKIISEIESKL